MSNDRRMGLRARPEGLRLVPALHRRAAGSTPANFHTAVRPTTSIIWPNSAPAGTRTASRRLRPPGPARPLAPRKNVRRRARPSRPGARSRPAKGPARAGPRHSLPLTAAAGTKSAPASYGEDGNPRGVGGRDGGGCPERGARSAERGRRGMGALDADARGGSGGRRLRSGLGVAAAQSRGARALLAGIRGGTPRPFRRARRGGGGRRSSPAVRGGPGRALWLARASRDRSRAPRPFLHGRSRLARGGFRRGATSGGSCGRAGAALSGRGVAGRRSAVRLVDRDLQAGTPLRLGPRRRRSRRAVRAERAGAGVRPRRRGARRAGGEIVRSSGASSRSSGRDRGPAVGTGPRAVAADRRRQVPRLPACRASGAGDGARRGAAARASARPGSTFGRSGRRARRAPARRRSGDDAARHLAELAAGSACCSRSPLPSGSIRRRSAARCAAPSRPRGFPSSPWTRRTAPRGAGTIGGPRTARSARACVGRRRRDAFAALAASRATRSPGALAEADALGLSAPVRVQAGAPRAQPLVSGLAQLRARPSAAGERSAHAAHPRRALRAGDRVLSARGRAAGRRDRRRGIGVVGGRRRRRRSRDERHVGVAAETWPAAKRRAAGNS